MENILHIQENYVNSKKLTEVLFYQQSTQLVNRLHRDVLVRPQYR